jgi:hypothetical protein
MLLKHLQIYNLKTHLSSVFYEKIIKNTTKLHKVLSFTEL